MGKLIRKVGLCITLMCLLWTGAMIADISNRTERTPECDAGVMIDATKAQELKQAIREKAGEYAGQVKNVVIDALVILDRVIDNVLEAVGDEGKLENIFHAG